MGAAIMPCMHEVLKGGGLSVVFQGKVREPFLGIAILSLLIIFVFIELSVSLSLSLPLPLYCETKNLHLSPQNRH